MTHDLHLSLALVVIVGIFLLVAVAGFGLVVAALAVPRLRDALWPGGERPAPPAALPAAGAMALVLALYLTWAYLRPGAWAVLGNWSLPAFSLGGELLMVGAAVLAARISGIGIGGFAASLGLGRPKARHALSAGLTYASSLWALMIAGLITLLFYRYVADRTTPLQELAEVLWKMASWPRLAMVAVAVLVAPAAEEILFRGMFFGSLRACVGFWPAAVASNLLFAAIHFAPAQLLQILVLGFALTWLYNRTGSLWPGIMLHMLQNMISMGLLLSGVLPGGSA